MNTFRVLAAGLCLIAAATPSRADDAAVRSSLAVEIINKMPLWTAAPDPSLNEFFRDKLFPTMVRQGVKLRLADELARTMSVGELETYKGMLENPAYKAVLDKLGRINAMMQSTMTAAVAVAVACYPVAERPEPLRNVPEYPAAERDRYCK